jgi:methylmalonyl-CoA mutase cobalamin-binding domain/chain
MRKSHLQKRRPSMTEALIHALVDMQEKEALQSAQQLLEAGTDPMAILAACSTAMEEVGRRFEKGEYFLPQLMMAGEMLKQISRLLRPLMVEAQSGPGRGRVLIGTVKGDIHDIGKNIVVFLLEANGFEVRDIGVDQHPDTFVAAVRDFQPAVVGLSGLLTLAFESMKATVQAIEAAGLRDTVRIIIGGAQVTEQVKEYTGADAFGADAVAGLRLIKQWMGGS